MRRTLALPVALALGAPVACDTGDEPNEPDTFCVYSYPRSECLEFYAAYRTDPAVAYDLAEALDAEGDFQGYRLWFDNAEWPDGEPLDDGRSLLDICAGEAAPSWRLGCVVELSLDAETEEKVMSECIEQVGAHEDACRWMLRLDLFSE